MAAQQAPDFTRARWRKSSHSYSGNDCVEVAQAGTTYAVRDSKNAGGSHLTFSTADRLTTSTPVRPARSPVQTAPETARSPSRAADSQESASSQTMSPTP